MRIRGHYYWPPLSYWIISWLLTFAVVLAARAGGLSDTATKWIAFGLMWPVGHLVLTQLRRGAR